MIGTIMLIALICVIAYLVFMEATVARRASRKAARHVRWKNEIERKAYREWEQENE